MLNVVFEIFEISVLQYGFCIHSHIVSSDTWNPLHLVPKHCTSFSKIEISPVTLVICPFQYQSWWPVEWSIKCFLCTSRGSSISWWLPGSRLCVKGSLWVCCVYMEDNLIQILRSDHMACMYNIHQYVIWMLSALWSDHSRRAVTLFKLIHPLCSGDNHHPFIK